MSESALEIKDITKSFGVRRVVDGVSFNVNAGDIFGLIGPNGAGKTTTIRMMMDIIKPDSGSVLVYGQPLSEAIKNRLGYLPEERGLYKGSTVISSLEYFGMLKGMSKHAAHARADKLLGMVDLGAHRTKKFQELSRGMSQIIQFLITIIHEPSLMILDEPFANLDPVNTELLKDIILKLRGEGKAVILSTHRMNEVEELCDRVFMINRGKGVLYGNLSEIKAKYQRNSVFISYQGTLGDIRGATVQPGQRGTAELLLEQDTSPQDVLHQLVDAGVAINRFEISTPPLHDIFLQVVGENDE